MNVLQATTRFVRMTGRYDLVGVKTVGVEDEPDYTVDNGAWHFLDAALEWLSENLKVRQNRFVHTVSVAAGTGYAYAEGLILADAVRWQDGDYSLRLEAISQEEIEDQDMTTEGDPLAWAQVAEEEFDTGEVDTVTEEESEYTEDLSTTTYVNEDFSGMPEVIDGELLSGVMYPDIPTWFAAIDQDPDEAAAKPWGLLESLPNGVAVPPLMVMQGAIQGDRDNPIKIVTWIPSMVGGDWPRALGFDVVVNNLDNLTRFRVILGRITEGGNFQGLQTVYIPNGTYNYPDDYKIDIEDPTIDAIYITSMGNTESTLSRVTLYEKVTTEVESEEIVMAWRNLLIFPLSENATSLYVRGWFRPASITSYSETNWWLTWHPTAVVQVAGMILYGEDLNPDSNVTLKRLVDDIVRRSLVISIEQEQIAARKGIGYARRSIQNQRARSLEEDGAVTNDDF